MTKGKKATGAKRNSKAGAVKHRASTAKAAPSGSFRIVGTALVALVFLAALYTLARVEPRDRHSSIADNAAKARTSSADKTQYTFHSRLEDFEIRVDASGNLQNTSSAKSYLIQAGSFRTRSQAERRLVELKLLGLDPRVEERVNQDGSKWQRVLLGPFDSRSRMSGVRNALLSNDIDAMVMQKRRTQ
ncbi:MAG: sporulation protein [Pseudomonadales bacterium]|nr:sporulation protein [Pseudomonadales bacterium]NNM11760.1 sporulation protein [Pseudomonadales bacterium]